MGPILQTSYTSVTVIVLQLLSFSCMPKNVKQNVSRSTLCWFRGSSGIGKSYFAAYFIWRLFHPDGELVANIPETIVWCPQPGNNGGYVYHQGFFYEAHDFSSFFVTSKTWVDKKDAWIIYDGKAPSNLKYCNTLVISSPGVFQSGSEVNKQFLKMTACKSIPSALDLWRNSRSRPSGTQFRHFT